MKFPKFKKGDKVTTGYSKGTVKNIYMREGKRVYGVVFVEGGTEVEYKENEIKFYHPEYQKTTIKNLENIPEQCPSCMIPWKKTSFGNKVWNDCPKCGKKAEDCLYGNPDRSLDKKEIEMDDDEWGDLLAEFERMLGDD